MQVKSTPSFKGYFGINSVRALRKVSEEQTIQGAIQLGIAAEKFGGTVCEIPETQFITIGIHVHPDKDRLVKAHLARNLGANWRNSIYYQDSNRTTP